MTNRRIVHVALLLAVFALPLAAEGPWDRIAVAGPALTNGRPLEAKGQLVQALQEFRELKDGHGEAATLLLLGITEVSLDNIDAARTTLEEATQKLRDMNDALGAWMGLLTLSRLEKGMGRWTSALADQDEALSIIINAKTSTVPFTIDTFLAVGPAAGMPTHGFSLTPGQAEFLKPILLQYFAEPLTHDGYASLLIEVGQYERAEEELNAAVSGAGPFLSMYDSVFAAHLGDLRFRKGRFDEARVQYQKALGGSLRVPLSFGGEQSIRLGIYNRLAELEIATGHGDEALGWNAKVLEIARDTENRGLEVSALDDRGDLLMRLSRFPEAEAVYEQALQLAVTSGDKTRQAYIETSLGSLNMLAGNYGVAAVHLEKAVELYQSLNDPLTEAPLWINLAVVHILMGANNTANQVLARARELAETSHFELAGDMISMIEIWQKYTRNAASLSDLNAALDRFACNPQLASIDPGGDMERMFRGLFSSGGRPMTPPNSFDSRPSAIPVFSGFNYLIEGRRQFEQGNLIFARDLWKRGIDAGPSRDLRAYYMVAIGATYWKEGNAESAIHWFTDAAKALEVGIDDLQANTMLAAYFGSDRRVFYDVLVEALLKDNQIERAFDITERARARAFLRLLGNHRLRPATPDSKLAKEVDSLRLTIANWDQAPVPGESLEDLRLRYETLLSRLQSREYASVTNVEPLQLEAVRKELPADTTLLSYYVSPFGAHAWILDAQTLEHVRLDLNPAQMLRITCWADQLGRTRSPRPLGGVVECGTDPAKPEEAYAALIAPLRDKIRNPRLMISPHGDLHYVPFAALYDTKSKHYLVEDYTITYAPSASTIRFLRGKESPVNGGALVLGDPVAPAQTRLRGAKEEAQNVAEKLHTTAKLGKDAQESLLYGLNGRIDLLHIAAHASYDATSPLFSAIYLAEGGGKNGQLNVDEIQSVVDLTGVNLVVLSACRSGVGKRSGGDEVVGLTRSILYAGSPGVISTLWNISDEATTPLIEKFYDRLLTGSSAADALRGAQTDLLHDANYAAPYYWAAFLLTGNPTGTWKR